MAWEFQPQFFSENKTIGSITETTLTESSVDMAYTYNAIEKLLKVEIHTECVIGINAESEADVYSVIQSEDGSDTMMLSILNEPTCPPPYFRYILRKIYCS